MKTVSHRGRAGIVAGCLAIIAVTAPSRPATADSIRNREWIVGALHLDEAHRYSTGRGIVVAVIDSGVDAHHPDLTGNVLPGSDTTTGAPKGRGDSDGVGHGTAIAGLVAGHGHGAGHSDGVIGIAPDATILPVRDGGLIGFGIISGIDWATTHGARVICIAQADPNTRPGVEEAINRAERADIVVIAGVGNGPGRTTIEYPAAYPGVVAAAGTDENGNHADISATGPEVVLAAPATNLVQPYLNGGYAEGSGTSASTGIIAGAAALVRARFPKLSAVEVIHRLTATAIDKGPPGRDVEYGYGLINIVAALTANVPPLQPSATPTPSTPLTPSATITPPPSPTASSRSPAKSSQVPLIAAVASVVALLAILGAWTAARRRSAR